MFLLLLLAFLPLAVSICYFPNGNASIQDTPCLNNGGDSFCCGQGYICLSNHLCEGGPLTPNPGFVRGSCTDQSYKSAECPSFCLGFPQGGVGIQQCPAPNTQFYCCTDESNCNCTDGTSALTFFGSAQILTTIGVPASTASSATTTPESLSSTQSSSPFSSATPISILSSQRSSTSLIILTSVSFVPSSSSSAVPSPAISTTNSTLPIAIAVPVGVIALVVFAYFIYHYRKTQKRLRLLEATRENTEYNGSTGVYKDQGSLRSGPEDIHELIVPQRRAYELSTMNEPYELPNHRGY